MQFEDNEFDLNNMKMENDVITNSNNENNWKHCTKYFRRLDMGVFKFEFELMEMHEDKSGLVIGFSNSDDDKSTVEGIQRSVIGINNNDALLNKCNPYSLCKGNKIECRIECGKEISFKVDNQLVLKTDNLSIFDKNVENGKLNVYLVIYNF